MVKDRFLTPAHLFGTICLKHSATLILPPLLKPPSSISKLFFTAVSIVCVSVYVYVCVCVRVCVCVCVRACVVSVTLKRPVLPL